MRGYVVERKGRFCAVIYEGLDRITGREHRRWNAAGTDRAAAERSAALLAVAATSREATPGLTMARCLLQTWLPRKRVSLGPSTWDGYRRNIELDVIPHIGRLTLRRLRGHHLDALYAELLANGRADGTGGLDPKSVPEIQVVLHRALRDALQQGLVVRNVADDAEPPKRRRPRSDAVLDRDATTSVLRTAKSDRLFPAFWSGG